MPSGTIFYAITTTFCSFYHSPPTSRRGINGFSTKNHKFSTSLHARNRRRNTLSDVLAAIYCVEIALFFSYVIILRSFVDVVSEQAVLALFGGCNVDALQRRDGYQVVGLARKVVDALDGADAAVGRH